MRPPFHPQINHRSMEDQPTTTTTMVAMAGAGAGQDAEPGARGVKRKRGDESEDGEPEEKRRCLLGAAWALLADPDATALALATVDSREEAGRVAQRVLEASVLRGGEAGVEAAQMALHAGAVATKNHVRAAVAAGAIGVARVIAAMAWKEARFVAPPTLALFDAAKAEPRVGAKGALDVVAAFGVEGIPGEKKPLWEVVEGGGGQGEVLALALADPVGAANDMDGVGRTAAEVAIDFENVGALAGLVRAGALDGKGVKERALRAVVALHRSPGAQVARDAMVTILVRAGAVAGHAMVKKEIARVLRDHDALMSSESAVVSLALSDKFSLSPVGLRGGGVSALVGIVRDVAAGNIERGLWRALRECLVRAVAAWAAAVAAGGEGGHAFGKILIKLPLELVWPTLQLAMRTAFRAAVVGAVADDEGGVGAKKGGWLGAAALGMPLLSHLAHAPVEVGARVLEIVDGWPLDSEEQLPSPRELAAWTR